MEKKAIRKESVLVLELRKKADGIEVSAKSKFLEDYMKLMSSGKIKEYKSKRKCYELPDGKRGLGDSNQISLSICATKFIEDGGKEVYGESISRDGKISYSWIRLVGLSEGVTYKYFGIMSDEEQKAYVTNAKNIVEKMFNEANKEVVVKTEVISWIIE